MEYINILEYTDYKVCVNDAIDSTTPAIYNGTVDIYPFLNKIITRYSTNGCVIFFPATSNGATYLIGTDITIPSTITFKVPSESTITIDSGVTLTMNGSVDAGMWQVFNNNGTLTGTATNKECYVEWFGAVADGSTDNTDAITDAIIYMSNNYSYNYGGRILFGVGTYVTGSLSFAPGVIFVGQSLFGTILKLKANTDDVMITMNASAGAGIVNITLDGSRTSQTSTSSHGIDFIKDTGVLPASNPSYDNCRLITLDGVNIQSFKGNAINVQDSDTWVFTVKNSRIVNCDGWGVYNSSSDNKFYNLDINQCKQGAVFNDGDNTKFHGGKWYTNGDDNLTGGSIEERGGRNIYTGIETQDNRGHALLVSGAYLPTFVGCLFDTAGFTTATVSTSLNMIRITGSKYVNIVGCIIDSYISNVTITDAIYVSTSSYIKIDAQMRKTSDSTHIQRVLKTDGSPVEINDDIRDNFSMVGQSSTARWCKVAVISNIGTESRDPSWSTELVFNKTKSIVRVYGTLDIDGAGNVTGTDCKLEAKINGESISALKERFYVGYSQDGGNTAYIHIWVYLDATETVDRNYFRYNTMSQGTKSYRLYSYRWNDLYTSPLATTSIDKTGHTAIDVRVDELFASTTYDPPSLTSGSGITTTLALTGAKLGDHALPSFSNSLSNVLMNAWVSTTDEISVRFQNQSTATVDLASGSLKIKLFKSSTY